jgi:cell wall-associated NlpC family hydrolase
MRSAIVLCLTGGCLLYSCLPSARFRSEKMEPAGQETGTEKGEPLNDLEKFVRSWLHVPYQYGGLSRSGVDCSGFSLLALRQVYSLHIPRTAADQYAEGITVRQQALLPGDLVFFRNIRNRGIDHVGIYLGDGRFAHATETAGVVVSHMNEAYYQEHFAGACRYRK